MNTQTFYFPPNQENLLLGGKQQKAQANLEIICLLQSLKESGSLPTETEQALLAQYTGWGNTAVYKEAAAELESLLAEKELNALKASMLNAHYTSLDIIQAIWAGVEQVFAGSMDTLHFLDPSAGIGHFRSLEPEGFRDKSRWQEVELEPLTAEILAHLHPQKEGHSQIFAGGFEQAPVQSDQFDLVISNIPFGNYPVVDHKIKDMRLKGSIHDYFLCKAVEVTAPGGLIALITSRYTLDKKDSYIRRWVARRAELLGAVRLPQNTFQKNAGTQVVTDVLFLRKRDLPLSAEATLPDWVETEKVLLENQDGESHSVQVNRIFTLHPDRALGQAILIRGMYAPNEYSLKAEAGADISAMLAEKLTEILPKNLICESKRRVSSTVGEEVKPAHIIAASKKISNREKKQIEALRKVYDLARALLQAEIDERGHEQPSTLRARLNEAYDHYLLYYGALSGKSTLRLLKNNPALPFLRALEVLEHGLPRKAAIFHHSTLHTQRVLEHTPSAKEAMLLCLDQLGQVELGFIARSAKISEAQALQDLEGLIYKDPGSGKWLSANAYLSGNILEKLEAARVAAEGNPSYEKHIIALREAMPKPLRPGEIRARLGSGWIPVDVIQSFLEYLLPKIGVEEVIYIPDLGSWKIKANIWPVTDFLLYSEWGTERRSALDLIRNSLNAHTPVVYDTLDEKRVMNKDATIAAQAKLEKIEAAFELWLWEEPEQAERLAQIYNRLYNIYRRPHFDGAHLSLPGMNAEITMRPHQLDAIWRLLQERSVLLAHEVGLGKTLTTIAAIMELKRLGRINKAMVVVPNHLTLQWQEETLWAYPLAKILCAGPKDLSKSKRGEFLSRIATGDWDIVIVPQSSFKLLPVGEEALNDFLQGEIDKLRSFLYQNAGIGRGAEKQIQKAIKHYEARLARQAEMRKDVRETITWEMLGLDMLLVDEFHAYKNLFFATKMSRVAGLSNSNSQRAFDMFIKSRFIQEQGGRFVGITATPVTNTLAEVFTLQRYFQYKTLERLNLTHFDTWAKMYAQSVALPEMSPEGGGFRINIRLAKFVNVPELSTLLSQFTASLKWAQIGAGPEAISRPRLHQARPLIVELPGNTDLEDYIRYLSDRATQVRNGSVKPEEDNMLKITSEGRKAALDMRLLNNLVDLAQETPYTDHANAKAYKAADAIAAIYHATIGSRAAQVVFSDMGTPKSR
jgi:N12 class adenine-specific DNA methylase